MFGNTSLNNSSSNILWTESRAIAFPSITFVPIGSVENSGPSKVIPNLFRYQVIFCIYPQKFDPLWNYHIDVLDMLGRLVQSGYIRSERLL